MEITQAPLPNKATHPHLYLVDTAFYVNKKYVVYLCATIVQGEEVIHLRIRRLDNNPITNFGFLQEVKNKFLGEDVPAIQVFPSKEDYIDNSNTYHMFAGEGLTIPNLKQLYFYIKPKKNVL